MGFVNDKVREAAKQAMRERGMTQEQLAQEAGIERPNVNAMLNGKSGKVPSRWEAVLDVLDLEVTATKKQKR